MEVKTQEKVNNMKTKPKMKVMLSMIDSLMTASKDDEIREYAKEYVQNLYSNERKRFNEAYNLVQKLDLAGLWRGNDIAIMMVAMAFEEYAKFF